MDEQSKPRHEQIAFHLRREIKEAYFQEGDKLPSEKRLCEYFNVSRITVRRALQTLENESLIYRKQGLGAFVMARKHEQPLIQLTDFSEDLRKAGYEPSSKIISFKQSTVFSNNIRNEKGFINFIENKDYTRDELLFKQNGKKVFKDVCPLVAELISEHLSEEDLSHRDIKKFWLHQANLNMNNFILKRIVGDDEFNADKAPCVLDEFANTSSAGSLIAYHRHNDLKPGDKGIICSLNS